MSNNAIDKTDYYVLALYDVYIDVKEMYRNNSRLDIAGDQNNSSLLFCSPEYLKNADICILDGPENQKN